MLPSAEISVRADRFTVDHDLDRHLARFANPCTLQVPVGLLHERAIVNRAGQGRRFRVEKSGGLGGHLDRGGRIEFELAARLADPQIVDLKVDQMAAAIADIRPALLDSFTPCVKIELAVGQLDVNAPQADAFAVDAGEVGLAGNLGPIPAIERVIPDIELPGSRRIDASR